MKRVLITGKDSYIGNSFEQWVSDFHSSLIEIESVSVRDGNWKNIRFSDYDTVLHVAGIAHVPSNENMKSLYEEVNTMLPYKVAEKARNEGVKQFIFMSSMIIYGNGHTDNQLIDESTSPSPIDIYGESKLTAEQLLMRLERSGFKIAIVRPPMVYGPNSKGNFPLLLKFANSVPFFPAYSNTRSMIFIDNLSECLSQMAINDFSGVAHPQNPQHMDTRDLVKWIRQYQKKSTFFISFVNPIISFAIRKNRTLQKIFGNFAYHQDFSALPFEYQVIGAKDSIIKIMEKNND